MTTTITRSQAPARLRDLSDADFEARYCNDRFTASLLTKRFTYAVEHMSTAFQRQAFSPIVAQFYDFSCTLSGPPELDYPMSAVSDSLLLFVGTMPDVVRSSVEEYGPRNLRDGDVLIANDPYRIGGHPNDLAFIKPVFHDGSIVAFVSMRVHQLDIGGVAAGGFSAMKRNAYENGLVIAPTLMWNEGKPVRSTFSLLFDNTRLGSLIMPDLFSTHSQLLFGERLVRENIERYGCDAVLGAMVYGTDTCAELMRDAIAAIPDGDYTGSAALDADGVDKDESFTVQVTIRKRGHQIETDLSGTSRQAQTCINASFVDTKNAIGCALSMLLAPGIPFTSGNWRDIDVVAPPGSLVSALPPDGAVMFYWEPGACILASVFKALNPILGENAMAGDSGSSNAHLGVGVAGGVPWVTASQVGGENGPWGATKAGDGDSYVVPLMINALIPGFEPTEASVPMVVIANEAVVDSAGAGRHRGGAALRRETYWLSDGEHYITPLRTKDRAGFGAYGGRSGSCGGVWTWTPDAAGLAERRRPVGLDDGAYANSRPIGGVLDPQTKCVDEVNGVYYHYASEPVWRFPAGTVMRVLTNAAGGWGDPFTREVHRVVADVRNGYVSIAGAERDYGVVIEGDPHLDPEGLRVDEIGTAKLRQTNTHDAKEGA